MLTRIFEWLDLHPGFYWCVAVPATLVLLVRVALAVRGELAGREGRRGAAAWDAAVLLLFLLAWRWPFLLSAEEYNPDESQFIAGAITLAHDPVFFRSVDGTTSGPLNFYALLPFHWLGLPLDYFTARVAAVLLNLGALWLGLRTLTARFGRSVAWLAVLPATAMFGTAWQGEFVHYSSELVSVLLLSLATWLLVARIPGERSRLWLGCAAAGLAPWAKLQSAPLAAVLGGWALWLAWQESAPTARARLRALGGIWIALVAPTVAALLLLLANGVADSAWRRYVLQNVVYVDQGRPVGEALRMMWGFSTQDYRMPLFLGTATILALAFTGCLFVRRWPRPRLLALAGALCVASAFAIVAPRREILHYTIFLVLPLTLALGAAFGRCWQARPDGRIALAAILLIGGSLPLFVTRAFQDVPAMFGQFAEHWRHPRSRTGEIIHALAGSQGTLAVWGWAQRLYVETGMPQATRDALTHAAIWPNPQQAYFRAGFLSDLRASQPNVFIDVVGTDGYIFQDRNLEGHEIVPELAEEIARHYTLVYDTSACRIYVRNDLPVLRDISRLDLDALAGRGREPSALPPPAAAAQPAEWRKIGDARVLMMHPPARVEWDLADNVRQLVLVYGFDPAAYERGTTNGAELVVELDGGGNSRTVFRRHLRPGSVAADRGRQTSEITLPPFSPNTRLIVRSEPGDHGDGAWDWLYVSRLGFRSAPQFLRQQFPGYSRVPESVDAPHSSLLGTGDARELAVHAPAEFRFRLRGDESLLKFDFGLHDGSYSDGGRTDGVVYRVRVVHGTEAPRVLFERHLEPQTKPGDRGPQHAVVPIAGLRPDDLLVVTLDPGPQGNAAWDWTFLRNVVLE